MFYFFGSLPLNISSTMLPRTEIAHTDFTLSERSAEGFDI